MVVRFIYSIYHFKGLVYSSGFVQNKLVLCNNPDGIFKEVEKEEFIFNFGNGALNSLILYPFFLYKAEFDSVEKYHQYARHLEARLHNIANGLWFVKDNSMIPRTLMVLPDTGQKYVKNINTIYSNASANYEDSTFTMAQLNDAMSYVEKLYMVDKNYNDEPSTISTTKLGTVEKSDISSKEFNMMNRITRANIFLQHARSTSILPNKISFYVMILECLFSANDSGEIQHKIGQRIAIYIGNSIKEKNEIYDFVKKSYSIRSKFVHGQELDKKVKTNEELIKVSTKLDSYIRTIFLKVILNDSEKFLKKEVSLKNWFSNSLFSELENPSDGA